MSTGAVKILIAATLWGVAGGIGGVLISQGWDPIVLSLYRGLLTLVFGLLWLAASRSYHGLSDLRLWGWSSIAGIGVAGAFSFYFLGMKHNGIAVAATLLYSAPVFVFLAGLLAGTERLILRKLADLALVTIGVALLTGVTTQAPSRLNALGIIAGLLSGVSYAAFIFGFRYASDRGSPQAIMTIAFSVECIVLSMVTGDRAWLMPVSGSDFIKVLLLGLLGGGPSFLLYIQGVRRSNPRLAAYTAMAEPVTAALFGYIVLRQVLSPLQVLGALIVIVTITTMRGRQY